MPIGAQPKKTIRAYNGQPEDEDITITPSGRLGSQYSAHASASMRTAKDRLRRPIRRPAVAADSVPVGYFVMFMSSKLTQWDKREGLREVKRGNPLNIYRLGLLLEGLENVRKDIEKVKDSTDPKDYETLKTSIETRFTDFPPRRQTLKAIEKYLSTGKRPKITEATTQKGDFMKQNAPASFKRAVPGNLSHNTKPSTRMTQKDTVELLKQGGILPPGEDPKDYPVLTANVKREIIATLLRSKQPRLATWASRNLPTRVNAAKNYASVVFLQNDHDFNDFSGSGGTGAEGFFDSSEKEMMRYLQQWDYGDNYGDVVDPNQQKGSRDSVYKSGRYFMTYNSGLGYAGLYVKA